MEINNWTNQDFSRDEQQIENSSIEREECSDDRPSNIDKIPFSDVNQDKGIDSWGSFSANVISDTEPQVEHGQEKSDEKSDENQKPLVEAVKSPEYNGVEEKQKPDDTGSGDGNPDGFDRLESMLDNLFEKVEGFQVTIDKQQDIIKTQKREIERYHNDEVNEKIRKPMLLDLIEVMDAMDMALEDYDRNPQDAFLGERMEEIRKLMKATLENYGVREIDDAEKQPTAVSRRQQVVGREVSDNPELFEIAGEQVNTFYKRDRIGYVMCENDIDGEPRESILRPEEVIGVVYRPREN